MLRSFHGLVSFYHRFVNNFITLVAKLAEFIEWTIRFEWGEDQKRAFNKIKGRLYSLSVLTLPGFTKTFEVECDTLGIGIRAVLMHEWWLLAYFSETLNGVALKYPRYDKEIHALVRKIL